MHCPTLFVTGEYDELFPPKVANNLAEKLNDTKAIIIPSAAHMIQLEQPALLSDVLHDFISGHWNIKK